MVEPILYSVSGFLLATLLWLLFLPAFWRRAVRVTRARLIQNLPISADAIIASQDRLRAEHAVSMRGAERKAERAVASLDAERMIAARARATELGQLAEIEELRADLEALEARNARLEDAIETATLSERKAAEGVRAAKTASDHLAAELKSTRRESEAAQDAAERAEREVAALRGVVSKLEARMEPKRPDNDAPANPMTLLMSRPKERAEA